MELPVRASVTSHAQPLVTFLSYAHHNHRQRKKLKLYLSQLESDGLIRLWDDRELRVGQFVDESIQAKMEESEVFVLLVSQEFLASDYCSSVEMARALERHRAGTALVFPIIVAPCDWEHTPLAQLVVAPTDGRAIARWKPQSAGWADVARLMREAIARFREKRTAEAPPRQEEGGDSFPPFVFQKEDPPAPGSGPGWGWIAGGAVLASAAVVALALWLTRPDPLKQPLSAEPSTHASPAAPPVAIPALIQVPESPKDPVKLEVVGLEVVPSVPGVVKIGKTQRRSPPYRFELRPGKYDIEVTDPSTGLAMKHQELEIKAGDSSRKVKIEIGRGTAVFTTVPTVAAAVYVDNEPKPRCTTPCELLLSEGAHTAKFVSPKRPKLEERQFTIPAGKSVGVVAAFP